MKMPTGRQPSADIAAKFGDDRDSESFILVFDSGHLIIAASHISDLRNSHGLFYNITWIKSTVISGRPRLMVQSVAGGNWPTDMSPVSESLGECPYRGSIAIRHALLT